MISLTVAGVNELKVVRLLAEYAENRRHKFGQSSMIEQPIQNYIFGYQIKNEVCPHPFGHRQCYVHNFRKFSKTTPFDCLPFRK